MIDKTINYKAIAMAIRNNLFEGPFENDFEFAKRIFEKCNKIYKNDSTIDVVFKIFVMFKTSTNAYYELQRYGYKLTNKQISETIFYRQCSDIEITLIAKEIFYTQHKDDFLKHQIDTIIQTGSIDIYKEIVQEYKEEFGDEYLDYIPYPNEKFYYEIEE